MNQPITPVTRAELAGYSLEYERAKAAAQKVANQRMAADLVENLLKPKVIRAAKEGAYEYEFPLYASTHAILPELQEAIVSAFPDVSCSLKGLEQDLPMIRLEWRGFESS